MSDLKKMIRALEICVETEENMDWADCEKCPYNGKEHCSNVLMIDLLVLLTSLDALTGNV